MSKKSCPVSVLAHFLPTGRISSRDFSRYVFSGLQPIGGVGYPAGVAIVDACAEGCVLGSERKLERPEEHMPPRLRRKLPFIKSSKFLLRGERSEIRELRTHSTAARTCDMYSSSNCDGARHVLSTLRRTARPTYSIYSSSSLESYVHVCSPQQSVIRTAAVTTIAAVWSYACCQRCYVRYLLRTVSSTAAAAVVLPSTQLRCG